MSEQYDNVARAAPGGDDVDAARHVADAVPGQLVQTVLVQLARQGRGQEALDVQLRHNIQLQVSSDADHNRDSA